MVKKIPYMEQNISNIVKKIPYMVGKNRNRQNYFADLTEFSIILNIIEVWNSVIKKKERKGKQKYILDS